MTHNVLQKHAALLRTQMNQFHVSKSVERFETQRRRIAQKTLIERHVFACYAFVVLRTTCFHFSKYASYRKKCSTVTHCILNK